MARRALVVLQEKRRSAKSVRKWAFERRCKESQSKLRLHEDFYDIINCHIEALDLSSSQPRRHSRAAENYSRYARGGECLSSRVIDAVNTDSLLSTQ